MTKENVKKKYERIFILNDKLALRINTVLAEEIGFNESIVLLQLEFLISISDKEREGKIWTYQSARNLKDEYFPFWSIPTIQRTLKKLLEKNYLIVGNFNKRKGDMTKWYALNFEKLKELKSIKIEGYEQTINQNEQASNQNEQPSCQNEQPSSQNVPTIPETTAETASENLVCKSLTQQKNLLGGVLDSEEAVILVYSFHKGEWICSEEKKSFVVKELIRKRLIRQCLIKINDTADSLADNEGQVDDAISMLSNEKIGYTGLLERIKELIELLRSERDGFEFGCRIPSAITFTQIRNKYANIKRFYDDANNNSEYIDWYNETYFKKEENDEDE